MAKTSKRKPVPKIQFEGLVKASLKITGGTEFDGEWVRKENPKMVRRVTLDEAAKMPFEEVLAACQDGSRRLIHAYPVSSHSRG